MNVQEAIEKIEKRKSTLNGWEELTRNNAFNEALDIVRKINEPEKPVVPKFVAEWIESQKESFSDSSAIDMYDNLSLDNKGGYYHEVWLWVIAHHYDFIKAWHDGYTVEKEKLYTVGLPNNLTLTHIILTRNIRGEINLIETQNNDWEELEYAHLTESEIKQDFEWAWQFAKEVEE